jgi:hypothetical protein
MKEKGKGSKTEYLLCFKVNIHVTTSSDSNLQASEKAMDNSTQDTILLRDRVILLSDVLVWFPKKKEYILP